MADRDTLIELSHLAWETLLTSLEGLDEKVAWASVTLQPEEYLHTEGSLLSQIAHVASGKFIYASVGFRETEIRFRDLAATVDSLWPNLDKLLEWLHESQAYWMESWTACDDLDVERPRFDGTLVPTWKLVAIQIHHEHYHAGQIQFQRSLVAPSAVPPPAEGALWEGYCKHFPSW